MDLTSYRIADCRLRISKFAYRSDERAAAGGWRGDGDVLGGSAVRVRTRRRGSFTWGRTPANTADYLKASMLPWELKELTEQRLVEAVTNGREESQTLEYKRSMPFGTWEERLKVLKAVSAFANTFGGDLVIGVDAADGLPQLPIVGIPLGGN